MADALDVAHIAPLVQAATQGAAAGGATRQGLAAATAAALRTGAQLLTDSQAAMATAEATADAAVAAHGRDGGDCDDMTQPNCALTNPERRLSEELRATTEADSSSSKMDICALSELLARERVGLGTRHRGFIVGTATLVGRCSADQRLGLERYVTDRGSGIRYGLRCFRRLLVTTRDLKGARTAKLRLAVGDELCQGVIGWRFNASGNELVVETEVEAR